MSVSREKQIYKCFVCGASGNVFMLIMLSSMVNLEAGKIPLTLILIFFFYIANEIIEAIIHIGENKK
mgnify:CR=1 FL=1